PRCGTRGGKYSLYDGGTHIPLIVYWKDHVRAGLSEDIVSQLDFFASLGHLVGGNVPENIDSRDHLDTFLGNKGEARGSIVLEAQGRLCYRSGDYALIPPYKGPKANITKNELGNLDHWSLFNLKEDRGQLNDLSATSPEVLEELKSDFLAATGTFYKTNVKEEELK
ncbi:MAG: sulfatase-like hydrolase/transferase, partial [Bacteroidales bacterium]|nr:sulfatase-like hydrolase/transferase [Bacteroidales bacterium]